MPDKRDIRSFIDAMLRAEKSLTGYGMWQPGNRENCHQWSRAVELGGEISSLRLEVKAYPHHDTLKFRILLNEQRCIWRLDFDHDGHGNPIGSFEHSGQLIAGPHCHRWEDNRRYATTVSLPKRLRIARILPAELTDFGAAFRWFCKEVRISIDAKDIPALPERDTLL